MGLILIGDNDIIIKLACCDMLDELPRLFGVEETDFRVLESARFNVSPRNKKLVAKQGALAIRRAHEFFCRVLVVEAPGADHAERVALVRPGIDAGEQVLFSATRNYENFYLLTGDKTSLRALQNAPKLDAVKQRLAGRILSFEAVLMGLLSKDNFAEHLPGIIAGASCDIALQASFGSDMQTTYDGAIEGLTSHYIALKKETGNLLGEL